MSQQIVIVDSEYLPVLTTHKDALQAAYAAGRQTTTAAHLLVTLIYDRINDWDTENDLADSEFWSLVNQLQAAIPAFQLALRETGQPYAEKPHVEIRTAEGQLVPYGEMVRLALVDVSTLNHLVDRLSSKMHDVSAELDRTEAEIVEIKAQHSALDWHTKQAIGIALALAIALGPAWFYVYRAQGLDGLFIIFYFTWRISIWLIRRQEK